MRCFPLQAYGAEAGPETAEQPVEEAGMTDEILQKVCHLLHQTC